MVGRSPLPDNVKTLADCMAWMIKSTDELKRYVRISRLDGQILDTDQAYMTALSLLRGKRSQDGKGYFQVVATQLKRNGLEITSVMEADKKEKKKIEGLEGLLENREIEILQTIRLTTAEHPRTPQGRRQEKAKKIAALANLPEETETIPANVAEKAIQEKWLEKLRKVEDLTRPTTSIELPESLEAKGLTDLLRLQCISNIRKIAQTTHMRRCLPQDFDIGNCVGDCLNFDFLIQVPLSERGSLGVKLFKEVGLETGENGVVKHSMWTRAEDGSLKIAKLN